MGVVPAGAGADAYTGDWNAGPPGATGAVDTGAAPELGSVEPGEDTGVPPFAIVDIPEFAVGAVETGTLPPDVGEGVTGELETGAPPAEGVVG